MNDAFKQENNNAIVLGMKTEQPQKRSVVGVYARHTFRYPFFLINCLLAVITMQVASLVAPLYLRQFFNLLSGDAGAAAEHTVLVSTLSLVVLFWLIDWAAHQWRYVCLMFLELRVMSDLYRSSFNYLLGHSYNFFVSEFAGSLTHRVSKFTKSYETLFDAFLNSFFTTTLFISGAVAILLVRNPILGIILAAWSIGLVLFQIWVSRIRRHTRIARSVADSRVIGNLADAISNQTTVTLFSGLEYERARFRDTVAVWRAATKRTWSTDAWIWTCLGFFMVAIQAVLFYIGIGLWEKGLFTIGDFVLIQAYLITAFLQLESLNRELRRVNDAYSDAQEMVDILNAPHGVADVDGAQSLTVSKGAVSFKDVTFYFDKEKAIFEDFDLTIRGGEKVALVGPSGAGKSTITKLILRLFDVTGGAIEIDGQNIEKVTQESLRDAISFVPQEPILFHRTLMENIRYGRRDASDEEVIEAAKKAHCHEFIATLKDGYDTYVGERGVKLSGGERQRVAIARAILKNAPILILDEATSSLDSESELLIQDALAKLMAGKTVLVIAHRLSTIMKMDRIIALDGGDIKEEGTHQELLAKSGLYAKLWSHQAGGFLQEDE